MNIRTLVASATLAVLSATSYAQAPVAPSPAATPGIDQRQANQERRIGQGVASGQLTRHEARRLHRGQAGVARAEGRAKADGVVTPRERRRLHAMQDGASGDIRRQKHDRQQRRLPPSGPGTGPGAAPGGQ